MSKNPSGPPSRQVILEALGTYQKRGRITNDVADMAELLMDESDRGVVVILGSLIEDILLDRLLGAFVPLAPSQVKNLTRGGGLLSSFDHRIALSHALGIIDDEMVEMLGTVKAMRNACAHSRHDISFLTPELREALALLFDGKSAEEIRDAKSEIGLRLMFIIAFAFISTVLSGETLENATAKGQRIMDTALVEAHIARLKHRPPRNGKNDEGS